MHPAHYRFYDDALYKYTFYLLTYQWRSKALRGSGSTVTWGPPFPSLPSPFPPLPQPIPSLCREAAPQIQLGGLDERCKLPSGVWGRAPAENLVHFRLKIRHLVATILMIFLRVLPKNFLWPHYSGAPGAKGGSKGGRGGVHAPPRR